jgi:membrane protein implicated in regulation of membrane protease activity
MRSMPSLGLPGDAKFTIALAIGLLLIALARWASRVRGTRSDSWIALRIGDVLLTEVIGAFLLGYGLGGLVAQPDAIVANGPPGRIGPGGRFGGVGASLPFTLGIVGAAVATLTRLDLSGLALRASSPRNGLSMYVGWDARVIAPISAGGFGQIAMRDGMGYPMSAIATAETDIPQGTSVRVIGTKGLNLLVAPVTSA